MVCVPSPCGLKYVPLPVKGIGLSVFLDLLPQLDNLDTTKGGRTAQAGGEMEVCYSNNEGCC